MQIGMRMPLIGSPMLGETGGDGRPAGHASAEAARLLYFPEYQITLPARHIDCAEALRVGHDSDGGKMRISSHPACSHSARRGCDVSCGKEFNG